MSKKKVPHSELLKCEKSGGTWIDGGCKHVKKKSKAIDQLKIKIKL